MDAPTLHTHGSPMTRQEDQILPQVNSSMKYFAKNLEKHLNEVLEYVAVDEGLAPRPPMMSLPTAECQDGKILLTSDSSETVIAKGFLSPAQPEEVMESAKDRKAALEWLSSVRQGRHKERRRRKKRKLCPKKDEEEEEEEAGTPHHTGEGRNSFQQGKAVTESALTAEEGTLKDGELSSSSCESDDSEQDRSKLESVAVTFVGGVMQASHKS